MRAELAAIDDSRARRRFARSASAAALGWGYGICLTLAAGGALLSGGAAVTASRLQLPEGGPGVLAVTVPAPAVPLALVAFLAAHSTRSLRFGLLAGLLALAASLGAVFAVLGVEGQVWMERRGVFMLDGDPPRHAVGSTDIVLDLFSTGVWLGHVLFWSPWPVVGAWLGARVGLRSTAIAAG